MAKAKTTRQPKSTKQLNAPDFAGFKDSLTTLRTQMPFLISMDSKQRQAALKIGDSRVAFVENAVHAAQNNPGLFPAAFNVQGFADKVTFKSQLDDFFGVLDQLHRDVADTRLQSNGDVMNQALEVKQHVALAAKRNPGLKSIADQLAESFRITKSNKAPQPAAKA